MVREFFWPVVLKSGRGNLGHDLEIVVNHGKVMLDTRWVKYSFRKLHEVMKKLIQRLHSKIYSFDKVLILGYGGGSVAQIIYEQFQQGGKEIKKSPMRSLFWLIVSYLFEIRCHH